MHLRATLHYDADLSRVAAMLADHDFVDAKLRASGAAWQQANVVGDAAHEFRVTARRHMPADAIPAQFRSFVGSTLEVRHVEAWGAPSADGERAGTAVVEIVGAPVRFTGRMRLSVAPTDAAAGTPPGAPAGARITIEGELKASVPLFASAIEEASAAAFRAALDAEEETGRAWLADRR